MTTDAILARAVAGTLPDDDEAMLLADQAPWPALRNAAAAMRDQGHGALVTYSRRSSSR